MANYKQQAITDWFYKRMNIRTIRGQLTVGLIATLIPIMGVGFYTTQEFIRNRIYKQTEKRLAAEAQLISYGLEQWGRGTAQLVEILSLTKSFRSGRIEEIQTSLETVSAMNRNRSWKFWSASQKPRLLAFSESMTSRMVEKAEASQASQTYYQAALRGHATYEVVLSNTTGEPCLNVVEPVFRNSPTSNRALRNIETLTANSQELSKPILDNVKGLVVLCLPLENLGSETGLIELFSKERLTLLDHDNQSNFMSDPKGFESAIILISNSGQLLFPDVEWIPDNIPKIQDLAKTSLPSLLPVAKQAMRGEEVFTTIGDNGHNYLALTARVDSAWSLILLLNERNATEDVHAVSRILALVSGCTLLAVLVVIAYKSRNISRPLSIAGNALQQIAKGNFNIVATVATDNEIGDLLRNVQSTADQLKKYVVETTSFAITQKQIDTAKSIQKDFLLNTLPESDFYEVAAVTQPALDIGADWYDMVDTKDYAVVLVADVCDKGVPSALYMSVFRSLIRSKLLDCLGPSAPSPDISEAIRNVIEETNNYMAINHNSSMMFATLYISAINKATGQMHSICAGHESPLLLNTGINKVLDEVSGPALGLFEKVCYSVLSSSLCPGDILLIYSDGLIDARNRKNEGWGLDRLRRLVAESDDLSPSHLLKFIIDSVYIYMDGAEQFDDLTLLVIRWHGK